MNECTHWTTLDEWLEWWFRVRNSGKERYNNDVGIYVYLTNYKKIRLWENNWRKEQFLYDKFCKQTITTNQRYKNIIFISSVEIRSFITRADYDISTKCSYTHLKHAVLYAAVADAEFWNFENGGEGNCMAQYLSIWTHQPPPEGRSHKLIPEYFSPPMPSPPIVNIWAVIYLKVRGEIIRTILRCIVYLSCAQS